MTTVEFRLVRRSRAAAMVVAIAATLIGCATYTVPAPSTPPVPAAQPQASAPSSPPVPIPPAPAVVDSAPSPEALQVLSSIPDPLTAAERVPPPVPQPASAERGATAARGDSVRSVVPVPEPTLPLGMRRRPAVPDTTTALSNPAPAGDTLARALADTARPAAPDTAGAAAAPSPAGRAPASAPPPQTTTGQGAEAAAEPDSCWRVQIAAPSVRDEAEAMRAAGESQLLLPMVIEVESGRYKVRSAPCMDRAAAVALRDRARAAGFEGAFPVLRLAR